MSALSAALLGWALVCGPVPLPTVMSCSRFGLQETPTSAPVESAAVGVAPEVEAILTRLESRGNAVNDLSCKLKYTVEDKVSMDELTKDGSILFKRAEPHEMFMVYFDRLVQNGVVTKMKEWYLFKDRWLWEAKERSKSIIKRECVRPGAKVTLFDLESAPFPIPFGQKKDQILGNFDVTLVAPRAGDPPNTDHLVCVPKPVASLSKDYERLEFFVSRELELPVMVVAVELGGNKITTATFPDLKARSVNTRMKDKEFAEPSEWKKFSTVEEPLPKPESPPGE